MWGWIVHPFMMLYSFYILARICDGHLTTALDLIVERIQMSTDVAGATFLAMASSAPELFTSIIATCVLESTSGVGNVLGSAVFNLLVIIGVVPIFAKGTLKIWWYPTARDAVFYSIAILEVFLVMRDTNGAGHGEVHWWEGLIMVLSYFVYVAYFTQNEKIIKSLGLHNPNAENGSEICTGASAIDSATGTASAPGRGPELPETSPEVVPVVRAGEAGGESEVSTEEIPEVGKQERRAVSKTSQDSGGRAMRSNSKNSFTLKGKAGRPSACKVFPEPNNSEAKPTPPEEDHPANLTAVVPEETQESPRAAPHEGDEEDENGLCRYEPAMMMVNALMPKDIESTDGLRLYGLFGLCCLWIGVFTYIAVDSSTRLGCLMKLDDEVMGLIVLAAGTSVPDAMGSIAVAREGMGDMAVANAVGSNTFDILLGLGLPWFVWSLVKGEPIKLPTVHTDFAIMVLSCCLVGYLIILIANGWRLTKRLGGVLLVAYVFVVTMILLRYYGHL